MKESHLLGAVCACLFTLFSMSPEAAIIDFDTLEFDDFGVGYINPGIYYEDEFTISGAIFSYAGKLQGGQYAGSAGLALEGGTDTITLRNKVNSVNNVFSIESISLARFFIAGTSPLVEFTGYIYGGGTVTQSFQPMSSSMPFAFTDFFFNSSFTNLTSLTWNQGPSFSEGHQFDNIVVTGFAVPIPAAVWLFGSGLLGLTGMARRKQA